MAGDAITVTLQVSEQIGNSTLQILNNDIVMTINDDTASATITVLENSTNGPFEFSITVYDKTGNVFSVTQDNHITDGNVVIDTNGPSIVDLTISSNNTNTSLATVNNILSITITANETLKAANITILNSTYPMSVNDAVASADVTVSQDSEEGDVSFNITAFDLAGNNFTADHTQLNSSSVTIDTSSPMLDTLTVYSDRPNMSLARIGNNVTITLDVTESLQNAIIEILNNTVNMTVMDDIAYAKVTVTNYSANGPVEFNITAYDKTGNVFNVTEEDITSNNTVIDTIDPTLVNLTISSNNTNTSFAKANDNVTITLTTTEPIGSISGTILNQMINAKINGTISTVSILVDQSTTNGPIEFSMGITDTNGEYMTTFNQDQLEKTNVFVDTMPPVITLRSGINSVMDPDGNVGDWIEINNTYSNPTSIIRDNDPTYRGPASITSDVNTSAVGIYHVRYDATDNAGNIAESVYRTVSVLNHNDPIDVELPLPHTNPVIYSNNTQLDTSIWNNGTGHSITFTHHYTQIIQNLIVIKIENTTMVSTADTNISRDNFSIIPILGYLNDNNVSGVSIGHDYISYDISSKPVMITFLNVDNISAADPFYRENGHDVNSIKEYTKSNILNSSTANTILSNDTNSTYNGTLYTKNVADKRITIWTHHLTYFGIYSTLGDGLTPSSTKSDAPGSPPTMGLANSGTRIVEDGFEYNGITVNVDRYYTEFPQISTNVGELNSLKMKFYDDAGPEGIKRVEVALGVPDIGLYHDAESLIEIWMDRSNLTVKEIIIVDDLNLLDTSSISASLSKTSCIDSDVAECLLVDLKYSYKESPAYEIIAIKPVDWDRNALQFYFNDGIRVHGNSLNIPKEIIISTSHAAFPNQNQEQLRLIQVDRINGIWVDQHGSTWAIKENTIRQITTPYEVPDSEKNVGILHGLGRHNANFESMKQLEALKAQEIAAELLGPTYRLNPLPENGGTIYFHASDPADESFEAVLKLEKTP